MDAILHYFGVPHEHEVAIGVQRFRADFLLTETGEFLEVAGMLKDRRYREWNRKNRLACDRAGANVVWITGEERPDARSRAGSMRRAVWRSHELWGMRRGVAASQTGPVPTMLRPLPASHSRRLRWSLRPLRADLPGSAGCPLLLGRLPDNHHKICLSAGAGDR
jgi:hypothetical protein